MKKLFFSLIAFIIILNNKVYAAIEDIQVDSITTADVIKMIVYLVVILILIYSLFWFINKRNRFGNSSSLFNSFGGYPLGQNKSIQIIEIGNKVYILGVSGEINLIKVLENEEDIKIIKKIAYSDKKQSNIFNLFKKKQGTAKQFENELAEKFDQLKEKRIYSINNIFEEREEITEKRD